MLIKEGKIILVLALLCLSFFYLQNVNAQGLININTATLEELDTLPGIGPSKAQAIIDYRTQKGPFQSIEEIINVSGIGQVTFNNIKDLITVGDIAEKPPAKEPQPQPEPAPTTELESEEVIPVPTTFFSYGDVVINELVSDPADEEVEFVELYNKTSKEINLDGWYLYDGKETKTILSGTIGESGTSKFFIIEKPKGNLNNSGDLVVLKQNDTIIDQVAYGDWDDGDINNNAPKADDPYSIARKSDGYNTFNNKNDFAITTTITKGSSNIITELEDEEGALPTTGQLGGQIYDYSNGIIISEIFPNPAGPDEEAEFIELFNRGEREVNLEGWALSDKGKRKYGLRIKNLEIITIEPKQYFVVYRKDSRIALNNTGGEEVKLYQPGKDEPWQVVKYDKAVEDWSYVNTQMDTDERQINTDNWVWTEVVTPGKANIVKTVNHPPEVDFSYSGVQAVGQIIFFDSSDTTDQDGDELTYRWDFSTGATSTDPSPIYIFNNTGMWEVRLTVSDGENEVELEKKVEITPEGEVTSPRLPGDVIISEFIPNPEGSDLEGEWIEVQNAGEAEINLAGWQLDDDEGGSRPFTIKEDIWLKAGEFYVFDRIETKLALNNTVDSVRLFNEVGELVEEIEYDDVKEGLSYVRIDSKWFWTTQATPSSENIFAAPVQKVSATSKSSAKSRGWTIETTLDKVREFDKGDLVKVQGVVAVLPNIFSSQYFYIVSPANEEIHSGLQIYSYKKDFPEMQVGDLVEVSGGLSTVYEETRLKTTTANDIKFITAGILLEPYSMDCDKIYEPTEGCLVKVAGEVVEKKGSTIYLDDGTGEVEVYIKQGAGINKTQIEEGAVITVAGIVSRNKDKFRVLPRSSEDIIYSDGSGGEVLGEISASDEWSIEQNNKRLRLMKYLLILAGGLLVVLGGLVWKEKRK